MPDDYIGQGSILAALYINAIKEILKQSAFSSLKDRTLLSKYKVYAML